MEQLEAALFAIGEGGIRLIGRTMDPAAISAARDAIARGHADRTADLERLRPPSTLRLVTDSDPESDAE